MRDRLLRDGFFVLAAVFVGLRLLAVQPWVESVDAYAYWATRAGDPYASAEAGRIGAYLYSPAFAQLLAPFVILPWPVFCAGWTALLCVVYWRLVGRLALPLLLFIPLQLVEMVHQLLPFLRLDGYYILADATDRDGRQTEPDVILIATGTLDTNFDYGTS